MASIKINDVSLTFSLPTPEGRNLKNSAINFVSLGKLSKGENGRIQVSALNSISLEFEAGDRVGVIGANGAGKTTFLRLVSGVYPPTSGSIASHGSLIPLIDIQLGLNLEASGRKNIYLRGALLGFSTKQIKTLEAEIIEFSGLGDFIDFPMRTYSSGMQMRLAFAISTAVSPDILVMDEWLSVGDEAFQSRAEQRMQEIVDRTQILILASHSQSLIKKVCNKAMLLENGELVAYGGVEDVLSSYFRRSS